MPRISTRLPLRFNHLHHFSGPLTMLRFTDANTEVQTGSGHFPRVSWSWDPDPGNPTLEGAPQTASSHVKCWATQMGRPCPNLWLTI